MTTRLKGFVITLEADIREDDAYGIIEAIRHIRGILDVQPVEAIPDDTINRRRVANDFQQAIWKAFEELKL